MKGFADYSVAPYSTYDNPAGIARYLLESIQTRLPAEMSCVLSCAQDLSQLEVIAAHTPAAERSAQGAAYDVLRRIMENVEPGDPPLLLDETGLAGCGYRSALVFPLTLPDEVLGLLALFSTQPAAYTLNDLESIAPLLSLVRTVLENVYLYNVAAHNMIVSQSTQLVMQRISENPSPQHVINILRDYFFDAHVTTCAMLLYGPIQEGDFTGPYEYLELKGTWSKRRGSGAGVGVRFYLKSMATLMEQLDRDRILFYPDARLFTRRLDPLVRAFMQAERMRSLVLLALHTPQRKLGLLVVGTDKRHVFTPQEVHSYQTVTDFMAVNAMTQTLQMQHDSVQQARAAMMDAVTDGVLMVLPTTEGARVLTVNQRFTDLFDIPEERTRDLLLADLMERLPFSESQRQELAKTWLNIPVRDPATQHGEFRMTTAQGSPMDIEWYSGPVYKDEYVLGRIYTFHDITPERTATRLRSAFLSRISHELRTPLTSIAGFAEFILEATGDSLPDLAREYTEIILSSARHLNHVFTDMIDITRADAGELKLTKQEAHLPDVIIDVVARMELQYKQRGQQVVMELDDDLPPVLVDVNRLIQVLTNLMTNAIKYAPGNTTIHITTEYIAKPKQLPASAPPDIMLPAVLVTVADEGKGLSKEDAEKVFMPFFRTEEAKVNKIEGVGLGLAVTRSFVEMHRGKIWAEPRRRGREGAVFLFTVPTVEN